MNIVPEDDVGFVADSGQSEPGLRHDLDEAISSEGAAGSDLHAGRMKSLRHLFMMDVQQPATRGRTTPSPTHARQRSERALFIVVLAVRSTHLVDRTAKTTMNNARSLRCLAWVGEGVVLPLVAGC